MARRKHERRRAREAALALLYSSDITENDVAQIVEEGAYPDEDLALSDYAEMLVEKVNAHRDEIDKYLAMTSENWALGRMPIVDRAILRVAVCEMFYVDAVPVSVAINEAVELAKLYGGEDESSRFVNGVLGRIARLQEEPGEGAADEAPSEGTADEAADEAPAEPSEEQAVGESLEEPVTDEVPETPESAEEPENPATAEEPDNPASAEAQE